MSSRPISTMELADACLQSLLADMADSTAFTASGTPPVLLLTQPERVEGYAPGTILAEVTDVQTEEHRNAGYDGATLSETDTYPAGEQKITEHYARRVHFDLSFRCIAKTLRGLLALRGRLEAYFGDGDDDHEYSRDTFSVTVNDYSTDPDGVATTLSVRWRYPTKGSTWDWLQVPGEQLLNGIFTMPVYVDARVDKTYDQIQTFTLDLDTDSPPP